MLSVRLPNDLEEKLNHLAELEKETKTDIVINALEDYIGEREKKINPYDLGADLFDAAGTGDAETSSDYKEKVGDKISEKFNN